LTVAVGSGLRYGKTRERRKQEALSSETEDEFEDDYDFGTCASPENLGLEDRLYVVKVEVSKDQGSSIPRRPVVLKS
jgi:hypothetical protein